MSYIKKPNIPARDGEMVVRLDDGNYVAVQCQAAADAVTQRVVFGPSARLVDSTGEPRQSSTQRPIETQATIPISASEVDRLTATAVVRECLLLVLGEPLTADPDHGGLTIIPWSSDFITQCSIRSAIAAASLTAPTASEVL